MSNYIEALKSVELQELYDAIELEAEKFESKFVELFSKEDSGAPKVPVFDFAPAI